MSVADITKELVSSRKELFAHGVKVRLGQEQTNHKIRQLKKYIARMLLALAQKRREAVQVAKESATTKPTKTT